MNPPPDPTRPHRRRWLALASALLSLACGGRETPTEPGPALAGLALTVMSPVEAAQPIELKIEAVGTDGSLPYAAFQGPVALAADRGTVTPAEVTLAAGTATTVIRLSAADGTVELTARTGAVQGKATLQLTPLALLPGDPGDPVGPHIPDLLFTAREEDYGPDPALGGFLASTNTLVLQFTSSTTVAQANAVLQGAQATLAGGVPGQGAFPGILFLRLPTPDHAALGTAVAALEAETSVSRVVPDALMAPLAVPANAHPVLGWEWTGDPQGGNWGLELMRAPQMWNLNGAIEKLHHLDVYALGDGAVTTGVLDVGFYTHPDLVYADNLTPSLVDDHGTHVAGIIAARWDNKDGIEGLNPFTRLVVMGVPSRGSSVLTIRPSWGSHQINGLRRLSTEHPEISVISMSLGYTWYETGIDPGMSLAAQRIVMNQGAVLQSLLQSLAFAGSRPVVVVSAGNDAGSALGPVEAKWNSPAAYAGLVLGQENIIVVEAVGLDPGGLGDAIRWEESGFGSNLHGHLSAPGDGILSTVDGGYDPKSGTSMATPYVAALAGYLKALDPGLGTADLRNLLVASAVPVQGASPRIDAFAAALEIDVLRGNDDVLRALLDIDDGTPDGNRRTGSSGADFLEEDADRDGGRGDGRIDMADFRRWRDWLLAVEDVPDLSLDGSAAHPKKDVNGDGKVEGALEENLYPRGDFNGDGRLSRSATIPVGGRFAGADRTDLEVLQALFNDPDVAAADLPGLVESGDIHVDLGSFIGQQGVVAARIRVTDGVSATPIRERTAGSAAQPVVITVATGLPGYAVQVEGLDAADAVVCTAGHDFTLAPGEDVTYRPECSNVVVEAQMAGFLEAGKPSPLAVRAGIRSGGTVNYQAGIQITIGASGAGVIPDTGLTDATGNFKATVTLDGNSNQASVSVTATDLATGQSATTAVSATALPPPAAAEFFQSLLYVTANAKAEENSTGDPPLYEENVLSFSRQTEAITTWACPDDAATHMDASASAGLDFSGVLDANSGYLRGFQFTSRTRSDLSATGASCGPYQGLASGGTRTEVAFKLLSGQAFMDIDATLDLSGVYSYRITMFDSDSLGASTTLIAERFSNDQPGGSTYQKTLPLTAGTSYYFQIEEATGAQTQNGEAVDMMSSSEATFNVVLRGAVPPAAGSGPFSGRSRARPEP